MLREPTEAEVTIQDKDLDWKAIRGSGPGGQNRNKVCSAIQLAHTPSGISVRVETERSQHQNKQLALALLRSKLWERETQKIESQVRHDRKSQVGSGQRGG